MAAVNSVYESIVACGVSDAANAGLGSNAECIATDIFNDNFMSCMDKSFEELDSDLKSYSELTVAQGQI